MQQLQFVGRYSCCTFGNLSHRFDPTIFDRWRHKLDGNAADLQPNNRNDNLDPMQLQFGHKSIESDIERYDRSRCLYASDRNN